MRCQDRTDTVRGAGRWLCPLLLVTLLAALAAGLAGCTRPFFRKEADKEVEEVLTEKNQYPDWAIKHFYVYPDPRARFADPTDPDHPPMPPDDPASAEMAPTPQKPDKAGVDRVEGKGYLELLAKWDAENRAEATARGQMPDVWREPPTQTKKTTAQSGVLEERASAKPLQPNTSGCKPFLIKMEQAAELGLINSREFQDRREDLYLTALPVTLERFAFAAQFFAIEQAIREWSGRGTPQGQHNRWNLNTTTGFAKLFSTGALLLFNVANQTLIELTGPNKGTISTSILNLDFIQPLLRGGGKAVTLEPLTQTERNLLYQIRTYARFRKEFFVSIAGGGGGSISGGTFVPSGVIGPTTFSPSAGFTSVLVPGVIDNNGNSTQNGTAVRPGTSGRLNLSTAIPPSVSGFLGTLLQGVQIAIDQDNISKLKDILQLMEATKEGGDVSQLQVDQVEQQLLTGYSSLYTDQQQYQDQLDRFKIQLGMPTDVPLEVDDTPVRPLLKQFRNYEEIFKQFADAGKAAAQLLSVPAGRLRAELHRLAASAGIARGTRFRTRFPGRWAEWEKLLLPELRQRLTRLTAERRRLLDLQTDLQQKGKNLSAADQKRLLEVAIQINLGEFEQILRDYEGQPWQATADPLARRQRQAILFRSVISVFMLVLVEPRNERLEALRKTWPDVPRVCVEGKDLLKTSLDEAQAVVDRTTVANRLDLMNVRGQMVDAWRQLAVFANALLGTFNVEYHLTSYTPLMQAKPLAFGGSRNHNQLIFNAELPLVRKVERNDYRASLIAYQRQRRTLQEAEDLAMQVVRGEIRQLRQFSEQYKIQQRQVELAYLTVENSLDVFQQPPAPGTATDVATRAATLVNQILSAQSRLPIAQNQILTFWTNYLVTRLQLYRDLELMPLDYRGVWIDDVANSCPDSTGNCRPPKDGGPATAPERRPGERVEVERPSGPKPVALDAGPR